MATFQAPIVGNIYTTTEVELSVAMPDGATPTYLAEVDGVEKVIRTADLEIEQIISDEEFANQKWECVERNGVLVFKNIGKLNAS
jgi:hypothetical protein